MAKKRRQEIARRRSQQKNKQLLIIGGIVVILVIGFGGLLYWQSRQVSFPENVAEAYAGFGQGITEDGYGYLESVDTPADAPVVEVVLFSNFACSHCLDYHESNMSDLKEIMQEGNVRLVFKPVTLTTAGSSFAENGAKAAVCAGEQGHFWEMNDILFYWQTRYGINGSRLKAAAGEIGLDWDQFDECYDSDFPLKTIEKATAEFRLSYPEYNSGQGEIVNTEIDGTPAIIINGQLVGRGSLFTVIEAELARLGLESTGN